MVMYNEINKYMAQWLRNLIAAGLIADGVVWECSIEDIKPEDLNEFDQCHFFAGLGGWSLALRAAGVPDDYPVWSASCPCQPFSAAGAGAGFADERHLWPIVEHLARECRPARIVGEQVASRDAEPWLDLVQTDMEALGYAFGAVAFPSAGVGAPHIRDRTYWLADADSERRGEAGRGVVPGRRAERIERRDDAGRLDNPHHQGLEGQRGGYQAESGRLSALRPVAAPGESGRMADTDGGADRRESKILARPDVRRLPQGDGRSGAESGPAGPTNGFWRDADWLGCRDGKWRPVEPGTFPLVDGSAGSVGRVRACWDAPAGKEGQGHRAGRLAGYGNAINIEAARVFLECAFGTSGPVVDDLSDLI